MHWPSLAGEGCCLGAGPAMMTEVRLGEKGGRGRGSWAHRPSPSGGSEPLMCRDRGHLVSPAPGDRAVCGRPQVGAVHPQLLPRENPQWWGVRPNLLICKRKKQAQRGAVTVPKPHSQLVAPRWDQAPQARTCAPGVEPGYVLNFW